MQSASLQYKQAMKLPIRNRGYIKASLGVINKEAQNNATLPSDKNTLYGYTNPQNIFSGVAVDKPCALPEQGYSKVNGSMYFQRTKLDTFQGAVTKEFNGSIYISFNDETDLDISGLRIDFGTCYPTAFTITNDSGTISFTNDSRYFTTSTRFTGTSYLQITPTAFVSGGENRLRILAFNFGLTVTFGNSQIMNYTQNEYVSAISDTVPSLDFTLTIDNSDLSFNPGDDSSLITFLENGQQVHVSMGYDVVGNGDDADIEWMPPVIGYLDKWSATDSEAEFTAVDRLSLLTENYYKGEYKNVSLYDLAVNVFEDAGVSSDEYFIDGGLQYFYTTNPMPVVTHASALQIIANAGRSVLRQDRSGKIYIQATYTFNVTVSQDDNLLNIDSIKLTTEGFKTAYVFPSTDYSRVDGSMYFLPEDYETKTLETGFVSSGTWNGTKWVGDDYRPAILFSYNHYVVTYGFTMYLRKPYPKAFTITTFAGTTHIADILKCKIDSDADTYKFKLTYAFQPFTLATISFDEGYTGSRVFVDYLSFTGATDYDLSRDGDLTASPTATRQNKLKDITIAKTTYSKIATERTTLASEEATITVEDPTYTMYFNSPSYGTYIVNVKDNDSITGEVTESSAYMVKITFSGLTADTTLSFEVNGYAFDTKTTNIVKTYNSRGDSVTWENPLVSSNYMANNVAEWLADWYQGNVEYDISWRGDPRTDANDFFNLETINSKGVEKVLIKAYQNQITFNGTWSGNIKARRVIEK